MFGVDVTITADMKSSADFLQKNSEMHLDWIWFGAPIGYGLSLQALKDSAISLMDVKDLADKFLKDAGQHKWKRS